MDHTFPLALILKQKRLGSNNNNKKHLYLLPVQRKNRAHNMHVRTHAHTHTHTHVYLTGNRCRLETSYYLLISHRDNQKTEYWNVLHIKHNIEKFSGSYISCLSKCNGECRNPYFSPPPPLAVFLKTVLPQQTSLPSKSSLRNLPILISKQANKKVFIMYTLPDNCQ